MRADSSRGEASRSQPWPARRRQRASPRASGAVCQARGGGRPGAAELPAAEAVMRALCREGGGQAEALARAVEELVRARADLGTPNEYGQTALLLAAGQGGAAAAVRALLGAGAEANERDGRGASALAWAAAFSGDAEVVGELLGARADLGAADEDGLTPLMAASHAGHAEVVRCLLAARAPA
ncbi:unnamed protein product, partial [Prorocentrum cordatum]